MKNQTCPCCSGKTYAECCEPFHKKTKFAPDALALMRSRYSAYALGLADYIIETTHPNLARPQPAWQQEILHFSQNTQFQKLDILSFESGDPIAYVTFIAHLSQNDQNSSFRERSRFEKTQGRWLYEAAETFEPYLS